MDFNQVKGQEHVRRALEVAVAGRHGILLIGPRRQGKTVLADAAREMAPVYHICHCWGHQTFNTIGEETLVAEAWLCACGGSNDDAVAYPAMPVGPCTCTPEEMTAHLRSLGPVFGAVDMVCDVPRLRHVEWRDDRPRESTATIRERVMAAREVQRDRYARAHFRAGTLNGDIAGVGMDAIVGEVVEHDFALGGGEQALLRTAIRRLGFLESDRWRAIRVARTIADLDQAQRIGITHLSEAIQYRGSRSLRVAPTEIRVSGNQVGKTLAGERAMEEAEAKGATIYPHTADRWLK